MKKLFYIGLTGLSIFEILNVYFIMPMPGSQQLDSIDLAYFLYSWRWTFRILFIAIITAGFVPAIQSRWKWVPILMLLVCIAIIYTVNFKMSADKMFLQVNTLEFKPGNENAVPDERIVVVVENNGEVKGYPVNFLAYHHQVRDSIGGVPVMITYCSVCRTGRVYQPLINGKPETFRLVGMNHFNAMFEDASTKSWWRQVNGEAIAGKLKTRVLPEFPSKQMTVHKLFELYPAAKVMQPDQDFTAHYDPHARFEQGKSKSSLTRTDSLSWKEKSWVAGIQAGTYSRAYDWNDLKNEHIIHDTLGGTSILLILSADGQSFAAYERPLNKIFTLQNDTLYSEMMAYDFWGRNLNEPSASLKTINVYQEFWHSWETFHPRTTKYRQSKGHRLD